MKASITENRLTKLREKFKQQDIDAVLINKRENYIYLSGFTGTAAQLIITQNEAILVTDFRYIQQADRQAKGYKIIQYQGSSINVINEELIKLDVNKLGFEESYITYSAYTEFKTKLTRHGDGSPVLKESLQKGEPSPCLVPLEGMIEKLRITKDQLEIEVINKAVQIADNAFTYILGYIKPGVMETEIAAEIEFFMKKQGAKGASFETIVASGERSSMPHGVASSKKLENGDVITLDYGAIYEDYCSDMTRTVFLGKIDADMKKIYETVQKAQLDALEGSLAGLTGKEIDLIARNIIVSNGYGSNFGHGLGHGVGLEIHEEPRLSPSGSIKMEPGMVVTIEPGIYIPGKGGVRIEDMIVIGDNGPQVLTTSSKDIIVI